MLDVPGSIPDRCRALRVTPQAGGAVSIMTRLPAACPRLNQELFVFSKVLFGPTTPPIQWVLWALFSGEKRPGCEADDSSLSIVEVHNEWSCTFISAYTFIVCTETCIYFTFQVH